MLVYFNLPYEDEEGMLDALIMAEVNVIDIECEDSTMTVTVDPTDFHKAKEAIDTLVPEVEYGACEITMLPQGSVKLESEEDKEFESSVDDAGRLRRRTEGLS